MCGSLMRMLTQAQQDVDEWDKELEESVERTGGE